MIKIIMIREIDIGQIVETGEYCSVVEYSMDRIQRQSRYDQNCGGDFRRGHFGGNLQSNQNYRDQNYRGGYVRNYRNDNYERSRIGLGIDNIQIISEGMIEAVVGLDQV